MLGVVAAGGFRQFQAQLIHAADVAASDERLTAMLRAYLAFASSHRALYRLIFGAEVREHRLVQQAARKVYAYLVDVIVEARLSEGIPDTTPRQIATLVFAATHGLVDLALAGHKEQDKAMDDPAHVVALLLRVLMKRS